MPSPASAALASNGANLWLESCEQASFRRRNPDQPRMSVGQDPLYGPAGRRCILFSAQGHKKPAIRQSICSGLVKTFQNACQQLSGPNVFQWLGLTMISV